MLRRGLAVTASRLRRPLEGITQSWPLAQTQSTSLLLNGSAHHAGAAAASCSALQQARALVGSASTFQMAVAQASTAQAHIKLPQEGAPDERVAMPDTQGKQFSADYTVGHRGLQEDMSTASYMLMHPVYTKEYLESVTPLHKPPKTFQDYTGMYGVRALRGGFDIATRYDPAKFSEQKWLQRMVFLETLAGVPGMVAGMLRHMRSLRTMKRDHGWIHTLLEEAENERMHLLTFLELRKPSLPFRAMVLFSQGVFFNAYLLAYLISPKHCHAFVGYLEEEAVHTYTSAIKAIDEGRLPKWSNMAAPAIAIKYWKLPNNATMRDVLLNVRADEACHSHVNHKFAELGPDDDNPFGTGSHMVA